MKVIVLLFGLLVVASATVLSQRQFEVKPVNFTIYSYRIFDVREPVPQATAQPLTPGTSVATRQNPPLRTSVPAVKPNIQPADREFEIFCADMGGKGFRLAHVIPRKEGVRVIFERETPPRPK